MFGLIQISTSQILIWYVGILSNLSATTFKKIELGGMGMLKSFPLASEIHNDEHGINCHVFEDWRKLLSTITSPNFVEV